MQEVRIFERFARRLPADSTENCKLSKRLEFYVQPGCVPGLRVPALNVQNLNSYSNKHLLSMRMSILKGSTFEEAHKKAMKSVGK